MTDKKNQSYWNEQWAVIQFDGIENPPHYEVSNYGRLRSFQSGVAGGSIIRGSVIQGYRSLNIRAGGKTLNRYVHKLVAEYFLDAPKPDYKYVVHRDHDKLNNYYQNIAWATQEDMVEHNRDNPSVINRVIPRRTRNYKLTETKVRVIKKMLLNDKNRFKTIAKQFGITHTQLNRIRSGENWKHVTLDDTLAKPDTEKKTK